MFKFPLDLQPLKESREILAWAKRASAAKKADSKVIDATIGVLKSKGEVLALPSVQKAMQEVMAEKGSHQYPGIFGHFGAPENQSALLHLAFGEGNLSALTQTERHLDIAPTIGGTYALFLAFKLACQKTILAGLPFWPNYDAIAEFAGRKVHSFPILEQIDQGYRLNSQALQTEIEKLVEQGEPVTLLLNDPCSNPAGLSLTEQDYSNIIATFKELEGRGITTSIILDPAYAAYDKQGLAGSSKSSLVRLLQELPNTIIHVAWSATKQYLEYNDRAGALFTWHPKGKALTDEQGNTFKSYMAGAIRGTLSQPPARTQKALLNLLNQGLLPQAEAERAEYVNMLQARAEEAVRAAKLHKVPLVTLPNGEHPGGFMAYTPIANAESLAEKLALQGAWVVPMNDQGLRIAISGLELEEIEPLYAQIGKLLNN